VIPVGTSLLGSGVDGDGVINELDFAGDQAGARYGELVVLRREGNLRDDTGNGVFLVKVKSFNPVAI
jgi:hypothetical protein